MLEFRVQGQEYQEVIFVDAGRDHVIECLSSFNISLELLYTCAYPEQEAIGLSSLLESLDSLEKLLNYGSNAHSTFNKS